MRSIEVAVEEMFLLQCVSNNFSSRILASSKIKVSRLTEGHLIEVRRYFDFLALSLTCCVLAGVVVQVSLSHKFIEQFLSKFMPKSHFTGNF